MFVLDSVKAIELPGGALRHGRDDDGRAAARRRDDAGEIGVDGRDDVVARGRRARVDLHLAGAGRRAATCHVNTCEPIVNVSPATAPPVVSVIVPRARSVGPVPTGSMRAKNPSPPRPICHCTGPVGLPANLAELGPLSWAPPLTCGSGEVAKLPLMSPE